MGCIYTYTHPSITVSISLYLPPRVWQQRYWAGWEHYRPGGPVFLLIGGEGEETSLEFKPFSL